MSQFGTSAARRFNANEVLMIGGIFATEVGGAILGGRLLRAAGLSLFMLVIAR
jgi:hypothetical protein